MKRFLLISHLVVFISFININLFAQDFEARVITNDKGYLEYQVRAVNPSIVANSSTPITQISFEIRWPNTSSADIQVLCTNNFYTIVDGLAAKQTKDTYYWRNFVMNQSPINAGHDWTVNVWETIVEFKITGTPGTTNFDVAPHLWVPQDLVWAQGTPTATTYFPTVNGAVSGYSYPTIVYNLVWTGAGASPYQNDWGYAGNWETTCGSAGTVPTTGDNCVIPVVTSGNYPINSGPVAGYYGYQPICNYLRINVGASMNIADKDPGGVQALYTINNDLLNYGTLTIVPNGELTVSGNTHIDAANGLVVEADNTGVGSFIDDPTGTGTTTITYGTSGSAKVQTYISNAASGTSFYMHLLGPTLNDTSYSGTGTGADLAAFNVAPGNTYTYSYDEANNSWVNQTSLTYHVETTAGIAISTNDGTSYTMNMVGEFITGITTSATLSHTGSNYSLISNPYPSSIDFDAFAADATNSSTINNKYWVWDESASGGRNYVARSGGSGGAQHLQVGQAFFVETKAPGTVTFNNSFRAHSNDPFRDVNTNELTMKVSGGDLGFKDELVVRFLDQGATYGYDPEIDAYKWNSMYEDATMIRSIAEDGSELAINFLPLDGLQGDMVSVPVHFQCGQSADYTFDFEGIDSFEAQNEVWLEDKQHNDDWIILNGNPHYTFSATPDEPKDRFILHFFGHTGVNDKDAAEIGIYSWKQYAYIKNITNENIKKVSIYDISGHLVTEKVIPQGQKLSKIWVSNQMAYYVVQVITDNNVYTNKILITK